MADAKWTQHPSGTGRLERVRAEFQPVPPVAILCRCENPYPLGNEATAIPLAPLASILASYINTAASQVCEYAMWEPINPARCVI